LKIAPPPKNSGKSMPSLKNATPVIACQPTEDSLEYDFVLETTQAEWHRIRNQHNYDSSMCRAEGASTFNWTLYEPHPLDRAPDGQSLFNSTSQKVRVHGNQT
jgi:hypothetical protein